MTDVLTPALVSELQRQEKETRLAAQIKSIISLLDMKLAKYNGHDPVSFYVGRLCPKKLIPVIHSKLEVGGWQIEEDWSSCFPWWTCCLHQGLVWNIRAKNKV